MPELVDHPQETQFILTELYTLEGNWDVEIENLGVQQLHGTVTLAPSEITLTVVSTAKSDRGWFRVPQQKIQMVRGRALDGSPVTLLDGSFARQDIISADSELVRYVFWFYAAVMGAEVTTLDTSFAKRVEMHLNHLNYLLPKNLITVTRAGSTGIGAHANWSEKYFEAQLDSIGAKIVGLGRTIVNPAAEGFSLRIEKILVLEFAQCVSLSSIRKFTSIASNFLTVALGCCCDLSALNLLANEHQSASSKQLPIRVFFSNNFISGAGARIKTRRLSDEASAASLPRLFQKWFSLSDEEADSFGALRESLRQRELFGSDRFLTCMRGLERLSRRKWQKEKYISSINFGELRSKLESIVDSFLNSPDLVEARKEIKESFGMLNRLSLRSLLRRIRSEISEPIADRVGFNEANIRRMVKLRNDLAHGNTAPHARGPNSRDLIAFTLMAEAALACFALKTMEASSSVLADIASDLSRGQVFPN